MNLGEMRTRTRIYLDDRNSELFTDAEVNGLINVGQEDLQKIIDDADELYFSACQCYNVVPTTTSLEFALPADFKKVVLAERVVTGGDPVPAKWVLFQRRHLDNMANVWMFTAVQPVCYLRGTKIGVVEPRDTYEMRVWYTKRLPDLSADADTTEVPAEWHNLLCLHAAKLGLGSQGKALTPELQSEHDAGLGHLSTHIEQRQKQTPRYVLYEEED